MNFYSRVRAVFNLIYIILSFFFFFVRQNGMSFFFFKYGLYFIDVQAFRYELLRASENNYLFSLAHNARKRHMCQLARRAKSSDITNIYIGSRDPNLLLSGFRYKYLKISTIFLCYLYAGAYTDFREFNFKLLNFSSWEKI